MNFVCNKIYKYQYTCFAGLSDDHKNIMTEWQGSTSKENSRVWSWGRYWHSELLQNGSENPHRLIPVLFFQHIAVAIKCTVSHFFKACWRLYQGVPHKVHGQRPLQASAMVKPPARENERHHTKRICNDKERRNFHIKSALPLNSVILWCSLSICSSHLDLVMIIATGTKTLAENSFDNCMYNYNEAGKQCFEVRRRKCLLNNAGLTEEGASCELQSSKNMAYLWGM